MTLFQQSVALNPLSVRNMDCDARLFSGYSLRNGFIVLTVVALYNSII